jgi:DNA polymerase-3 subunit delta
MRKPAQNAFKAIESDLQDGRLDAVRAVLLCGDEPYLVDHYEHRLRDIFVAPGAELLDLTRIDMQANDIDTSVSNVIAACDTLPMISKRRLAILSVPAGDERAAAQSAAKKLAEYIPNLPPTALLILVTASLMKNSALYKAFVSHGKVYEFARLERGDLRAFISGRFRRAGALAPREVVDEIINTSGYMDRNPRCGLFDVASDVSNIASYAAGGNHDSEDGTAPVTLADVTACMGTSIETDVFAMLDAVSAGRKGDALELVCNISGRGENAFGLLALLTAQFEIMLGYSELNATGRSSSEIMKTLGINSEYRLRKAAGFTSAYTQDRLAALLRRLYRVERDIKSGLYGERLALTMFIAEM